MSELYERCAISPALEKCSAALTLGRSRAMQPESGGCRGYHRSAAAALDMDFAIGPEHLEEAAKAQGVEVRAGDVALLRTGWAQYWDQPARYITGGRWLSERGVFAAGSDTCTCLWKAAFILSRR